MEKISSIQNNKIKYITKLSKHKKRIEDNLFIIEGARELSLAISANYIIESVFLCQELFDKSDYPDVLTKIDSSKIILVDKNVFDKIAYRENSDGIITLSHPKIHTLESLKLKKDPFIIILEAVEKPGNLGAILRTADASKVDAVIICDTLTDLYNPNVIRSSVGCIFTVPIAICSSNDALNFLHNNNIISYAAELEASELYHKKDYTKGSAIIMGTEADGLTNFWIQKSDHRIIIPMRGKIDSLNVSVSTAIITFEAMRQRGF